MVKEKRLVVRVTKTEFELDNGRVFEMPIELEEVPPLKVFQQIYDQWSQVFQEMLEDRDRGSFDQHSSSIQIPWSDNKNATEVGC